MNTRIPAPTLEELIGATVIVGITRRTHEGELIEQRQYVGTFAAMTDAIRIALRNGGDLTLPPDLDAFRRAERGIYRLRSTGEEIENPDFVASWTVHAPAPPERSTPTLARIPVAPLARIVFFEEPMPEELAVTIRTLRRDHQLGYAEIMWALAESNPDPSRCFSFGQALTEQAHRLLQDRDFWWK